MSIDTERYAEQYAGELRDRLRLDGLRSDLEFPGVMASSRRAARRRRAGLGGGLAAALALGVLASPVGLDAPAMVADAMRSARLAHVDGLAGDLSAPLHVAWTVPGFLAGEVVSDGTVLVTGGGALRALAADGTERWSVATTDTDSCGLRPDGRAAKATGNAAPSPAVLCADPIGGTLRLIDPHSGAVITSVVVSWAYGWAADLIGDDVAAVGVDAAGRAVATRWHRDGTVVWDRVGPVLSPPVDGRTTVVTESDVRVISGPDEVRFDPTTGDVLAGGGPREMLRVQIPGGYTAVQLDAGTSLGDLSVEAYAPDGSLIMTVPGHVRGPSPDDGSVPGLVLVQDASTLRALDLVSGTEAWSEPDFVPVVVLDGHVIGWSASNELESLDARTGAVLWQRPSSVPPVGAGAVPSNPAVTDGRTILTIEYGDQPSLVAVDVESGALRWSEPWEGGADVALGPSTAGVIVNGSSPVTLLRQ
jgi:outer membrane protein assembly factor BamB